MMAETRNLSCWICGDLCAPEECRADEYGRTVHERCYFQRLKEASTSAEAVPRHQCLVYEGAPSRTLSALAEVVQRRLKENRRCLYLNSPPMVAGMKSYLAAKGVAVGEEISRGSLVLSAEQSHLMDGRFDVERMMSMLESALSDALKDGYEGLWASGDMTWEFGPKRDFDKVLEYEWRLERLFMKCAALSGICQYHRDTLPVEVMRNGLISHRSLFLNETLSRINPHYIHPEAFDGRANDSQLDQVVSQLCQA